ncbi:DUF1259 domain-containing protein [Niallia oryzisoli]|uniref:DUF1259 domain-containing protein n=1 Tax=Niallia oryzisoli TaxID=1737571 RepID=A0ABZ2C8A3_9BACI
MEERDFWNFMYGGSNRRRPHPHENFDESSDVQSDFDERKRHKRDSHGNVEGINRSTCQKLADIIGGEVITSTPVCLVQRLRDINATILGRRTQSPLALPFALSFEDHSRNTLNLGETVILQKEINPFITELRKRGIIVTALHNHWLFEEPRLMYMHWENVGDPFEFARMSFEAAKAAGLF